MYVCSNAVLLNLKVGDHVHRFVIKGRLQLLEMTAMKHICFPNAYPGSRCPITLTTTPHMCWMVAWTSGKTIRKGTTTLSIFYMNTLRRCLVMLVASCTPTLPSTPICWAEGQPGALDTSASKPDIILIDETASKVYIIEVSCPFDACLQENYDHKFAKYMLLCQAIQQAEYDTKVLVFMVGSLGGVYHRVVPGLQLLGYGRGDSAKKAKYLSISSILGSKIIWGLRAMYLWTYSFLLYMVSSL